MGIDLNHLDITMKKFEAFVIVLGLAIIFALLVIWWIEFIRVKPIMY
jgi:hypothetical protein